MSRRHRYQVSCIINFNETFDILYKRCKSEQYNLFGYPMLINNYVLTVDTVLRMTMLFEQYIHEISRKSGETIDNIVNNIVVEDKIINYHNKQLDKNIVKAYCYMKKYNNEYTEDIRDYTQWEEYFNSKYPELLVDYGNSSFSKNRTKDIYETYRKQFLKYVTNQQCRLTARELCFVYMYVCNIITSKTPNVELITETYNNITPIGMSLAEKFEALEQLTNHVIGKYSTTQHIKFKVSSLFDLFDLCANQFVELIDVGVSSCILSFEPMDLYVTKNIKYLNDKLDDDDEYMKLDKQLFRTNITNLITKFNKLITLAKIY